jgi:DNA-binding HxlR family transcriptional regulator
MASENTLFYTIFEDELRQKILVLINQSGSLSYSDLMEKLDIVSERLLNYHLKVLGDLISKNEEEQYALTERGLLALNFLKECPIQETRKIKERKHFWLLIGIATVILFFYNFVWYFRDGDFTDFILRAVVLSILIFALAYCMYLINPLLSGAKTKIPGVYITLGGLGGFVIGYFGLALMSGLSIVTGGPSLLQVVAPDSVHLLGYLSITTIIGCFVGYGIGKKLNFRLPNRANK